jgi:hypothetical protein
MVTRVLEPFIGNRTTATREEFMRHCRSLGFDVQLLFRMGEDDAPDNLALFEEVANGMRR